MSLLLMGMVPVETADLASSVLQVKSIHRGGVIELVDGTQLSLLGIHLPPEGLRLLSVLVAGKEVLWEKDNHLRMELNEAEPIPCYLYVEVEEMTIPYEIRKHVREKKVMVNEFLLILGGARMSDGVSGFKFEETFQELQIKAKVRGEGIWSYSTAGDWVS